MSVIMTLRASGDPSRLEEYAAANAEHLRAVADRAREHGAIAHRFYGSDDGQVMVVDEWPNAEAFQAFFEAERSQIEPIMEAAGVTAEPEVTFWRRLETHDEVGWDD